MTASKTPCTKCGCEILQSTADRYGGLCGPCHREATAPAVVKEHQIVPDDPVELDIDIDVDELGDEEAVNWEGVEEALFQIASAYITAFAEIHHGKTFYGLAFDCNADFGQVFFCANTLSSLRKAAERSQSDNPKLSGKHSAKGLEDRLRWSLGDWEFQAFTTEGFSDAWEPIEDFLVDAIPFEDDDDQAVEEFRNSFLETACRAMIRLEAAGVLDAISRTDDFKTFVADHDEPDEASWERLESIRRGFSET